MHKKRALISIILIIFLVSILTTACNKQPIGESATRKKIREPTPVREIKCTPPTVLIESECCIDDNNNTQCDKYEELCGDGICGDNETMCGCPDDCGECETQTAPVCQMHTCNNDECVLEDEPICCGDGICGQSETCTTCFQDCCDLKENKATLSEYPKDFQLWDIVIGNDAPQQDVIIGGEIMTHIAGESFKAGNGKLASEINLKDDDFFVLGNPCDNDAAYELWKKEILANNHSCQIFKTGEALLKFFATSNNNVALYIGGYNSYDTYRAANVLINYEDFNGSLDGKEFKVTGTKSNPKITKIS